MIIKIAGKKLRYIKAYKDRHGKVRSYYRRDGQSIAIKGDPSSPEWLASYNDIHLSWGKTTRSAPDGSFSAAVEVYYASDRFQKLKPKTKDNYRKALEPIIKGIGKAPVASLTRGVIVQMRNQIAENSPRRAVEALKVLKLVLDAAFDEDMVQTNVAAGVKNPVGYKPDPHRPWAQEDIELFIANASPIWRRAFMVALYTGLRRDDVINLTRDHISNGRICIETGKTGVEVVIPVLDRLAEELDRQLPIPNVKLLVTGTRGRKIRGDVLTHSIAKEAKRIGIANPAPFHGLRKNAVMRFIEAGLDDKQIHAITGQSSEMIEHYGQEYDRHRLVDQAVIKLTDKNGQKPT